MKVVYAAFGRSAAFATSADAVAGAVVQPGDREAESKGAAA
jgi:hypothetical protein